MEASRQWQLANDAAERYERILVPAILGPFAQALVEWTELKPGEHVADIGTGTGAAARHAAQAVGKDGKVIGVDVNPNMLAVAEALPPPPGAPIAWQQHNAYALPIGEAVLDAALCAQTLQFLDQRTVALAEMRRVLKPGGRACVSTWTELADSPYFAALVEAMAHNVGKETAVGLGAAFGLPHSGDLSALLAEAGFNEIHVEPVELTLELEPIEAFAPRHITATPMAAGYAAAAPSAQQAVLDEMKAGLAPYRQPGGKLRVPFRSHFARGRKA